MNDPIAWRRAELERKRDRHLRRMVYAVRLGIDPSRRDMAEVRQCQSELEVLELADTADTEGWFDS